MGGPGVTDPPETPRGGVRPPLGDWRRRKKIVQSYFIVNKNMICYLISNLLLEYKKIILHILIKDVTLFFNLKREYQKKFEEKYIIPVV